MTVFASSIVKLTFEISHIDGKSMSLQINSEHYDQLPVGIFQYETAITFPEQLTMLLSGKGPNDTVVDDQGNILADKYVKLTGLQVDGLDCPQEYLEMFIVLDTDDGQKVASNYFGFNGLVTLDFLEENSFFWSTNVTKQILKK